MNYQLAGALLGRWIGRLHMAVTIRDVARQAGVSIATVSKVVNGNDSDISKATQERVRAAVEELGYQPNSLARSLRTRRSNTIGFIVPDFEMVLYPPMIKGIDMEAAITDSNDLHAEVKHAMVRAAKQPILVMDSSKFDKVSFVSIAKLKEVSIVVTNCRPSQEWMRCFARHGIQCVFPEEK